MGFFSGLVTGAAEGATKSLQSEIDKRDAGLSRARVYAETRFRQQELKADDHDDKVEKAVDRFMTMFTSAGDTKAIAAKKAQGLWTGLGGTLDTAESYIKELDLSKNASIPVDINEDIKFKGIDLGVDYTDVTRQSILDREAFDRKDFKVNYTDKGILGKLFKKTDYTEELGSEFTNKVKPADLPDVTGLTAAVDFSNTATAREARNAANVNSFEAGIARAIQNKSNLNIEDPDYQIEYDMLTAQQEMFEAAQAKKNASRSTATRPPSFSEIGSVYRNQVTALEKRLGWDNEGSLVKIIDVNSPTNATIQGAAAQKMWDAAMGTLQNSFMKHFVFNGIGGEQYPDSKKQAIAVGIPESRIDGFQNQIQGPITP